MFTARCRGGDIGNHCQLTVADERVLEDLSKFAASERRMLLFKVEGPDALLESQQRLIDLGSV